MIKFFRHIRRSLIQENKMSKYFKYAVGEIVLVMIGILLALQVNNWNENRKLRSSEQAYFENLKEEVLKNDIALKLKIEQYKDIDQSLITLADLMRPDPSPIDRDRLDSLVLSMTFMPVYNPVKTFINSDNLENINNATLKELIASWNFELERYTYDTKIIYDLYYNAIYPFLEENYQLKTSERKRPSQSASEFPINQTQLLASPVFENQVTMKSVNHKNALRQLLVLAAMQKKIINVVAENTVYK